MTSTTITEIPTRYNHTGRLVPCTSRLTYYAVSWPYGRGTTTERNGTVVAACDPIAFASRTERDAWVADGPSYQTERGYREAVTLAELPYGWAQRDFRSAALERNGASCTC